MNPIFNETLGKQIKKHREIEGDASLPKPLDEGRFDSIIEKVESDIVTMHRPIVYSGTADVAQVGWQVGRREGRLGGYLDTTTFEYMSKTVTRDDFSAYVGQVSSYNSNTYKGRLYIREEKRTIPFELAEDERTLSAIRLITDSLSTNAISRARGIRADADVAVSALRRESVNGRLKSLFVTDVARSSLSL